MKQTIFGVLFFTFYSLFAQVEITNIKLPKIILSEHDSILSSSVDRMAPVMSQFLGINIKDSLDLNKKKDFGKYEEINRISDSISIYVDANNTNFSVHFWSSIPPPPPLMENKRYSKLKIENLSAYNELMAKKWDSMAVALEKQWDIERRQHQIAYPVYIFNNSSKKTIIQNPVGGRIDKDLYVILEGIDKNGEWQPINYWEQFSFVCGTGHRNYVLNPKSFLIVAIKKYSGHYRTKLRVKFKNFDDIHYSNVFDGYIDYCQFDKHEVLENLNLRFSYRGVEYLKERVNRTFLDK